MSSSSAFMDVPFLPSTAGRLARSRDLQVCKWGNQHSCRKSCSFPLCFGTILGTYTILVLWLQNTVPKLVRNMLAEQERDHAI